MMGTSPLIKIGGARTRPANPPLERPMRSGTLVQGLTKRTPTSLRSAKGRGLPNDSPRGQEGPCWVGKDSAPVEGGHEFRCRRRKGSIARHDTQYNRDTTEDLDTGRGGELPTQKRLEQGTQYYSGAPRVKTRPLREDGGSHI